jgi:hypothetical protein
MPVETDIEHRLNALMARYGKVDHVPILADQLAKVIHAAVGAGGIPSEVVAYTVAQYASAYIAAQKVTGVMRSELADALADDFLETVKHRSIPGVFSLVSKQ